jgi:polysaccharide biosynthesis protein PslH
MDQKQVARTAEANRITFMGGLNWPPNIEGVSWFVRRVWPQVSRQEPSVTLTIVGRRPPSTLLGFARRELRSPHLRSRVDVTGYVQDLAPYIAESRVSIVPIHSGSGMRGKILDAWCWGMPVVTTSIGAEGIRVKDGDNALVADTAESFARAIIRLLREPDLAMHLSKSGRQTVEAYYNWRDVYWSWEEVYETAARRWVPSRLKSKGLTDPKCL